MKRNQAPDTATAPETPTIVRRNAKGQLLKGSGPLNPTGRPKGLVEALKNSPYGNPSSFMMLLTEIIRDGQGGRYGPRESWDATKLFAAYIWGRPIESLNVTANVDVQPDLTIPLGDLLTLAQQPLRPLAPSKALLEGESEAIITESKDIPEDD